MTETEFVALLDRLVARDQWLTETAVPMFQRAAASIGRSVKDPAVRRAFDGWIASATAVATRYAEGKDIADAEVVTLGVHAAVVARRLAQAGAAAEAQPEVVPTANPQCGYSLSLASDGETETGTAALGSDQDDVLAQARARVAAARATLADAQTEAFAAEMALAEIEAHTVPVQASAPAKAPAQAETEVDEGHGDVQVEAEIVADAPSTAQAKVGAKAEAVDSRPRIHSTRRVRHSVPKKHDHRPRIRRAETVVA